MDRLKIYGINIHNTTLEDATKIVEEYLKGDRIKAIFTPNTEIVMSVKKDYEMQELINRADLITPDGIGLIYASRIKKKPLTERVTGFDLSIRLLEIANKNGYGLYLLGGKEGVAQETSKNISKDYPNINILGHHHGYFKGSHIGYKNNIEELGIIEDINTLNPDIIFVGLGFPKQEIWIDENKNRICGKIIIGNGGVMDVLAKNVRRAPEIYQKLGLEWFYRLITNPSRIRRQLVIPKFMLEVIFKKDIIE